jgi:hypothetical protein
MKTDAILNLTDEIFEYSQTAFARNERIETVSKENVNSGKQKNIKELKGKIKFREDYDYKSMRN